MIIDSHEHVCYLGYGADDVIAEMDAFGIDVTWLLTWYLPPNQHVPGSYRTESCLRMPYGLCRWGNRLSPARLFPQILP